MRTTLEFGGLTQQEINESFQSLIALLTHLDPDVLLQIANSIWYRLGYPVEQDFINVNQTYFDAEVRELDFSLPEAVDIINGWVAEKTNGLIEEVIDRIDHSVVMFLINAIYFKGTWTYEFDEDATTDDLFTRPDGSRVPCRMMRQVADFSYFENDAFQAVDLPYGNGKFSMTIFLPKPEKSTDNVIAQLTPEQWTQWMGSFSVTTLDILLPRFKIEYEILMNDVLTALGMGVAFSSAADFSRINPCGELFISRVIHKTFVEVNEEGTEAAAVTVVELRESVGACGIVRMDRPFIFVIREDHSNTILFIGKIVEPLA
jgi:serpin B